jgi:glycosyltransferase involved in cell wall biosynthesis
VTPPSISIALTTFNGERFLAQQLDSLARQSWPPCEVQIGDDGSSDATEQIVRDFAARAPFPVHFHRNPEPLGYGENFIRTALRCSGDWIAFCDQDDVWLDEKLERCAQYIGSGHPDLRLIVHDCKQVNEDLQPLGQLYNYEGDRLWRRLELPPEWYSLGVSEVFDATLLRDIPSDARLSFPWHVHRDSHDVWIALLANATGAIYQIAQPLVLYRRHSGTVTGTATDATVAIDAKLKPHGREYGDRARYLEGAAARLAECAKSAPPDLRRRLASAARKIHLQAEFLERRSVVYEGSSLHTRLSSLRRLLGSGGYFGTSGWSFGPLRFIKDLVYACLSAGSGPRRSL